ncbi:hypothetical protein DB31_2607 [Hyalangium minutum]|uniref:Uncharacterized protein n=1 Tax=Hyalangium minutum TaxID=394096 RepID=A0A085W726_9BACT|nr:hypothetical protein DB31_2607 [Hyalangium minutum]
MHAGGRGRHGGQLFLGRGGRDSKGDQHEAERRHGDPGGEAREAGGNPSFRYFS